MLALKFRTVLVEAVSNEHGNVIKPVISWGSTEQNPVIRLGNCNEALCPVSRSNQSLFVEDEECIFYLFVFRDVVPRINRKNSCQRCSGNFSNSVANEFRIPVQVVSF